MTETAEQYSKRKFISYLKNYDWNYQYSVFYTSMEDSQQAIEHGKVLRKLLVKYYSEAPFLWRLCLREVSTEKFSEYYEGMDTAKKTAVVPFHMLLTKGKQLMTEELGDLVEDNMGWDPFIMKRPFSIWRILSYVETVSKEAPYDLQSYFNNDGKINRFSMLNKSSADPSRLYDPIIVKYRKEIKDANLGPAN